MKRRSMKKPRAPRPSSGSRYQRKLEAKSPMFAAFNAAKRAAPQRRPRGRGR